MIGQTFRRRPGGPRYDASRRAAAREALLRGEGNSTTLDAAVDAMQDPDGIEVVADVLIELESNRLHRDEVVVSAFVDGAQSTAILGKVDLLASGRMNPSRALGLTDVTLLDSGATVFGPIDPVAGWTVDDKPFTSIATVSGGSTPVVGRVNVLNGDASLENAAAGRGRISGGTTPGANVLGDTKPPTRRILNRDGSIFGAGWMNPPVGIDWSWEWDLGSSTPAAAGLRYLGPVARGTTSYRIGESGTRRVSGGAYLVSKGAAGLARARVGLVVGVTPAGGVEALSTHWGDVVTVPDIDGSWFGNMNPVHATVTVDVTAAPGSTVTSLRPVVDVDPVSGSPSPATGFGVSGISAYSGDVRDKATDAVTAAAPSHTLEVVLALFDAVNTTAVRPRRINSVEISGSSPITSASVEVEEEAGVWIPAGVGSGTSRTVVDLDRTFVARRVRVRIEEARAGEGSAILLNEIDPRFVEDASDDVVAFDLEWSRESDPSTTTSPVGNYEASTLSLVLDDTDGRWNPARNQAIEVGHRIEVATGVRYSNVHGNRNGERGAAGWITSGNLGVTASRVTVTPTTGLAQDAPASSAVEFRATYTDPVAGSSFGDTAYLESPPIAVVGGEAVRLGVWAHVDAPENVGTRFSVWTDDPVAFPGGGRYVEHVATRQEVYAGDGWRMFVAEIVAPANATLAGYRLKVHRSAEFAGDVTTGILPAKIQATRGEAVVLDENGDPIVWEELFPAGVFYSEPVETSSGDETITIEAVDKLARLQGIEIDEPTRTGQSLETIVRDLALKHLDYDTDQVAIDPTLAAITYPYAFAEGDLGTFLADVAKAALGTLHVDAYERLAIAPREDVDEEIAADLRADLNLTDLRRPPSFDATAPIVTVTGGPFVPGPAEELWTLPEGETITIPGNTFVDLVAPYGTSPAVNGYAHALVTDGAGVTVAASFGSHRAKVRLTNSNAAQRIVSGLTISGSPLEQSPLAATIRHEPSVLRYGAREVAVSAKFAQTQARVNSVAQTLAESLRPLDENGVRRMPDLIVNALGLLHLEAGDRVLVVDPDRFVAAEHGLLGRKISFSEGALLLDDVRVREIPPDVAFAYLDRYMTLGGTEVAAY